MISPLTVLSAAMTIATVPASTLGCPRQAMTSAGVLATEHEWVRAIETRDSRALSCILAPEFLDSDWRGELMRRGVVLNRLPSRPSSRLRLTGLSVFHDGRFAILRGINTQTGADDANPASVRFTDVFLYRGGAWRAISAQETLIPKE